MPRSLFAVVMVLACQSAQADPVPPPPSVTVGVGFQFVPGAKGTDLEPVYLAKGGRLFLAGADVLGAHTIVSYDTDRNGIPLFSSDQAAAGQVVEVIGATSLPPGNYLFACWNHFNMNGLLTVRQ